MVEPAPAQVGRSKSAPLQGKPARLAGHSLGDGWRSGSTLLLFTWFLLAATGLGAAERIPAAPPRYFNDYAGVVGRGTADTLNRQLEQFERDSSNQILVVVYPKMESDSSVEDYTVRVAQAWRAGQQGKNNGAVLFAFMQSHDLYLQVGYGLEGAIPDAIAKRIITQEIVPRFRAGDVAGGMTAAVNAMIAAAKGEYQGTGRTRAESQRGGSNGGSIGLFVFFLFVVILISIIRRAVRRRPGGLLQSPPARRHHRHALVGRRGRRFLGWRRLFRRRRWRGRWRLLRRRRQLWRRRRGRKMVT